MKALKPASNRSYSQSARQLNLPNICSRVFNSGTVFDVLDIAQFLTANVYERSLFVYADCKLTLASLLGRYNEIVAECENDPTLRIRFGR